MHDLIIQILVLAFDTAFPQPINSNVFNYYSQDTTINEQNYEMPNHLLMSDYVYFSSDAMYRSRRQSNFTSTMENIWVSDFKEYIGDENINLTAKNERNVFDEKFFTNRRLSKEILPIEDLLRICENCNDSNQTSVFPIISVMRATDYDVTELFNLSADIDLYLVKIDLYVVKNKEIMFHKSVTSYFLQNKSMKSLGFDKKQFQIIIQTITDDLKYYSKSNLSQKQ